MSPKEHLAYFIANTSLACAMLFVCWGEAGWLFQAGILYAGITFGHLITEVLNHEGDTE
jgi:hypothetical protein